MQPQSTDDSPQSDATVQRWQIWVIAVVAFGFLFFPFLLVSSIDFGLFRIDSLGWQGFFYILALLPAAIGITHHVVSTPGRHTKVQRLTHKYRQLKASTGTGDGGSAEDNTASVLGACASALLLTGVFFVVAAVNDALVPDQPRAAAATVEAKAQPKQAPLKGGSAAATASDAGTPPKAQGSAPSAANATESGTPKTPATLPVMQEGRGLVIAGLGAYIAVLFYMAGRLYANALSSRFLATSALRSASAVALGYVLGLAGIANVLPSDNTTLGVYFMVGLFHNWAMNALRTKASTLLGAPKSDNEELPITIIEGIEDTSADLLSEYGVSTVQHLALTDGGELSERTLIPLERVLDWTDQAILIQRIKRAVASTRTLGIRTATDLARQFLRKQAGDDAAKKLLDSMAEKSGLGAPAVETIARELAADARVALIYKTLQGTDLTPTTDPIARFDAEVDRSLQRYAVTGLDDGSPVGRLSIRTPAPPPPQ